MDRDEEEMTTASAGALSSTTRTDAASEPTTLSTTTLDEKLFGWVPPSYLKPYLIFIKGVGGCLISFFLVAPDKFFTWIWSLVWTVAGVTLGIGFGAGLALHVFHQLQAWQKVHDNKKHSSDTALLSQSYHDRRNTGSSASTPKRKSGLVRDFSSSVMSSAAYQHHMNSTTSFLEDGNSYLSLMAQAGYPIPDRVLRGQVLREDHSFFNITYQFTDAKIHDQQAVRLMADEFPTLPEPVTRELGRFIEHVMRDYISGWYCRLDSGILYRPEAEKREEGIPRDGGDVSASTSNESTGSNSNEGKAASNETSTPSKDPNNMRHQSGGTGSAVKSTPSSASRTSSSAGNDTPSKKNGDQQKDPPHSNAARKMVFSTLTHRRAPMIDCTYRVLSAAFGNLATRAEHVNVPELVLLKWTQVLGHTFKTYRTLRKVAQEKNASHGILERPPTELEITREYLLAGKLHRAIIFGLDVPSLLFADASGDECGCGTDVEPKDPTQVLEQRLYHTNIVRECELDYNRVVASRLIRALLPKSESNSHCVMALVVEIFAACVFQPLMNLWVPSFLNDIIVKAMAAPMTDNDITITTACAEDAQLPELEPSTDADHTTTDDRTEQVDDVEQDRDTPEIVDGNDEDYPPNETSEEEGNAVRSLDCTFQGLRSASFGSAEDPDYLTDGDASVAFKLLTLSRMALVELAKFMNFDECRDARTYNRESGVDWDDPDCQTAVLKLVLVIEAALLDGRCSHRKILLNSEMMREKSPEGLADNNFESSEIYEKPVPPDTMTHLLMEMTSDMEAFEKRVAANPAPLLSLEEKSSDMFQLGANEVTTLRTLISTWLHTGQLYRALSLISSAMDSVFFPYYSDGAFLANRVDRESLVKEMKLLNEVDIMVETMVVLASPRLDVAEEYALITALVGQSNGQSPEKQPRPTASDAAAASDALARDLADFGHSTPRYLDFQRNAAFAASLRSERERRLRAWEARPADNSIHTVLRKTATKKIDFELHSELHNLVRLFFNGTNIMSIRDAARKNDGGEEESRAGNEKVSLLTVETAASRRRLEVPDDDSSFLLRAQARKVNPVSVHRDDRNHEQSFQRFQATYEEPAVAPGSTRYNGGKFLRRCLLEYYPSNRTASIDPQSDTRKLDRRRGKSIRNEPAPMDQNATQYLSQAFLREKHLCQKWLPKASQSFLSSSLMEPTDFNSAPRTGKALDFVYRMSLFERPVVDLDGKRFTIQDPASKGVHRADASSLEISDASLSYMLLYVGKDWGNQESPESDVRTKVEMGPDGYPMIFFRISTKVGEIVNTEMKPYRMSFIRAALVVTSSRQEAQNQSLLECIKVGSAKSATKTRAEEQLRPTLKILEFANDNSKDQTKASCLVRDLKLGIYHIDKQQLRRNGLLSLRHPTNILHLNAEVEGTTSAKDIPLAKITNSKLLPDDTLYKIRCTAVVELLDNDDAVLELEPYALDDGSLAAIYREEWIVYRSMKDFQILHKQLKGEVNIQESTMSTGTRIVGAATAALTSRSSGRRNKKVLIPSLAQAGKIGAMGVTKRSIEKRKELLDEYIGYLLSSNSLMNRCSELLLFLGASHPFPPEVTVTKTPANFMDPFGRMGFVRSVALKESGEVVKLRRKFSPRKPTKRKLLSRVSSKLASNSNDVKSISTQQIPLDFSDMDPAIASKVDQIPLAEVRNHVVELMRYSFGFENASFVRSQMLAALETASFVAIAKQSDFRRVLYNLHTRKLNGEALGGWIRMLLDLLWPDGVWMKPKPLLTLEEEERLRDQSREKLHEGFPDNFKKILGKELSKEGLDMIHDMLQNRLVVKSMFYMLFDLVWIEILPELRDSLPCASALDLDLL
ncbi:PXA domain containing protein [Nitzschia inconspicua]|uniref:PXA domain containing protein n=1 Tax=Nitzschia inconspicua TaxID=303405 RepID=A0A9K3KH05_9STRA|nr:PXA domain containing protein [Nitzschia inconspicua]